MKSGLDEVADGEALRRGSRQWLSRRGDGLRPHVLWLRRRQRRSHRRRRGRSGGLGGRRRARGLDEAGEVQSEYTTVSVARMLLREASLDFRDDNVEVIWDEE